MLLGSELQLAGGHDLVVRPSACAGRGARRARQVRAPFGLRPDAGADRAGAASPRTSARASKSQLDAPSRALRRARENEPERGAVSRRRRERAPAPRRTGRAARHGGMARWRMACASGRRRPRGQRQLDLSPLLVARGHRQGCLGPVGSGERSCRCRGPHARRRGEGGAARGRPAQPHGRRSLLARPLCRAHRRRRAPVRGDVAALRPRRLERARCCRACPPRRGAEAHRLDHLFGRRRAGRWCDVPRRRDECRGGGHRHARVDRRAAPPDPRREGPALALDVARTPAHHRRGLGAARPRRPPARQDARPRSTRRSSRWRDFPASRPRTCRAAPDGASSISAAGSSAPRRSRSSSARSRPDR